jgi:hypothetical protein
MYAGVDTYGKNRSEGFVDEHGIVKERLSHLPNESERFFSPSIISASSIGRPFRPTRRDSMPIPGRDHISLGRVREGAALRQRIAACGHAAGARIPITVVEIRPRVITARAKISSMDPDSTASILAASRLSKQLRMLFLEPSLRRRASDAAYASTTSSQP